MLTPSLHQPRCYQTGNPHIPRSRGSALLVVFFVDGLETPDHGEKESRSVILLYVFPTPYTMIVYNTVAFCMVQGSVGGRMRDYRPRFLMSHAILSSPAITECQGVMREL
jgi:hypothetical protein